MKIVKDKNKLYLKVGRSKFSFDDDFSEVSKQLILASDEDIEGVEEIEDSALKEFISTFLNFKKATTNDKIKEEIEGATGYQFTEDE